MNEELKKSIDIEIKRIIDLVRKIKNTPDDKLAELNKEAIQLSAYLVYLGTQYAETEQLFNQQLLSAKDFAKSVAEAELIAKATDEYFYMRKVKLLRESIVEVIQMLKRIFQKQNEGINY